MSTLTPVVRYVGVYRQKTPSSNLADFMLPYAEARQLIENGLAQWTRGCKCARLTFDDEEMSVRDQSCRMGPEVSEGNADGIAYYRAIVRGWRPVGVAAVCAKVP